MITQGNEYWPLRVNWKSFLLFCTWGEFVKGLTIIWMLVEFPREALWLCEYSSDLFFNLRNLFYCVNLIYLKYSWDVISCLCVLSYFTHISFQFSSVQSLSRVQRFVTPWTAARQASLSITNSRSLPKPMSTESVMPSSPLILCRPLLLLPLILPSIRVFSNESTLRMRWPNYWSFRFFFSLPHFIPQYNNEGF